MSEDRVSPEGADADDLGILDDLLGLEPEAGDEDQSPEPEPRDGLDQAEVEPPRQSSRTRRRVEALQGRLKERDDEVVRLRQDIERMMAQTRQPAALQPDPYRQAEFARQEQERLAMMSPQEIAAYTEQKLRNEFQGQLLRGQVETRDLLDRQLYETLKTRDRLAERFGDQVENLLAQARQQGMNPSREILLNALVGQEVRQKAQRQTDQLRRRGARQLAAQTTQPGTGGSTATVPSRRQANQDSDEALDQRLRNVTLGEAWRLGTG